MTLARLSLAALLVCAAAEQPHHVEYHAMTVDSEGDVSNEKMKHLMRSHPDVLEEERAEILPSAADLAYKAMDLGFGTTGMALDDYPFAATKHFAGQSFRSLFVAEEDLIFSSGLFSFLAQLHPLLFEDDSLWCISAWNDYSLAPFASDVSSVLRSSWFSGRAWMVTLRRIREELLPNLSLQQRWRPLLRQWAMAASKECLLPEVSRVAFTNYQCEGVGIRGQCDEEEVDARHRAVSAIFAPRKLGQLGEVGRLKKEKFVTLLGSSWPRNGGLRSAVAVTSVHQLYEDTATPLLLLIEDQEPGAWSFILAPTFSISSARSIDSQEELSPSAGGSVRVTGEVKEVQNGQRLILHDRGSTLQVDASSLIRPVNGVLPGVHVQAVGELEGPQLKARILRVLHNMDMALYEECLLLRRRVEAQYIDIPAPS